MTTEMNDTYVPEPYGGYRAKKKTMCTPLTIFFVLGATVMTIVVTFFSLKTFGFFDSSTTHSHSPTPWTHDPHRAQGDASEVVQAMDMTADPCEDFYTFACGRWVVDNQDTSAGDVFTKPFHALGTEALLEEIYLLRRDVPLASDFFRTCVDKDPNDDSVAVVRPFWDALALLDGMDGSVSTVAAKFQLMGIQSLFLFGALPDQGNPDITVGAFDQGGFLFPKDVYEASTEDDRSKLDSLRRMAAAYIDFVDPLCDGPCRLSAQAVVDVQTMFASIATSADQRLTPESTYHPMTIAELQEKIPLFDLHTYGTTLGVSNEWLTNGTVVVRDLAFFAKFNSVLSDLLDDAKNGGHRLRSAIFFIGMIRYIDSLPLPIRLLHSDFVETTLGVVKPKMVKMAHEPDFPTRREAECAQLIDQTPLAMLVGKAYVDDLFDPKTKKVALALIQEIEAAFDKRMDDVAWLNQSAPALAAAKDKLSKIRNKIGYPDQWPTFPGLSFPEDETLFQHSIKLAELTTRQEIQTIGRPTDKEGWQMAPQMINAYYQPMFNEMVFPAAILRSPFYAPNAPDALNFGGIGSIMGHEMSHGFDNSGREYNAKGQLIPWWPEDVIAGFTEAAQCVADLYSGYTITHGGQTFQMDGVKTLGENLADLGGIANAWRAFKARSAADQNADATRQKIMDDYSGLTPEKLFFVAYAQNWCEVVTSAGYEEMVNGQDVHSPGIIRVLGPVSQTKAFAQVFECAAGTAYNPETRCSVW